MQIFILLVYCKGEKIMKKNNDSNSAKKASIVNGEYYAGYQA